MENKIIRVLNDAVLLQRLHCMRGKFSLRRAKISTRYLISVLLWRPGREADSRPCSVRATCPSTRPPLRFRCLKMQRDLYKWRSCSKLVCQWERQWSADNVYGHKRPSKLCVRPVPGVYLNLNSNGDCTKLRTTGLSPSCLFILGTYFSIFIVVVTKSRKHSEWSLEPSAFYTHGSGTHALLSRRYLWQGVYEARARFSRVSSTSTRSALILKPWSIRTLTRITCVGMRWTFWFHKRREISWPAERGLWSVGWVSMPASYTVTCLTRSTLWLSILPTAVGLSHVRRPRDDLPAVQSLRNLGTTSGSLPVSCMYVVMRRTGSIRNSRNIYAAVQCLRGPKVFFHVRMCWTVVLSFRAAFVLMQRNI